MSKRSLLLDLPPALFQELQQVSTAEGADITEFVRVALEEKLADLRTIRAFREQGPWRRVAGLRRPRRRSKT
jgi:hypothetical protein